MSRKVVVIGLLIISLLAITGLVIGQGLPGAGWLSGQQILNTGSSPATIVFTAYNQEGSSYDCGSKNAVPGASVNYLTNDCPGLPAGFLGSGVVSADQPIAAIVNVTNEGSGTASGQYVGTDGADTSQSLSFPLMKNDWVGRTTHFYIQNASSNTAKITATATDQNGVTYPTSGTYEVTAQANAMVVIEPSQLGVPASRYGSLAVSADQLLAGSMLESETSVPVAQNLNASKGLSDNDYDGVVFCPMVRNGWGAEGFGTGLQVINVSGAPQTIKVEYSYQVGSVAAPVQKKTVTTPSVANGASFNLLSSNATYGIPANSLGSAKVTGNSGNVAALVSDEGFNTSNPYNVATYTCFPEKSASTTVYAPLYKQDWIGDTSGIQIQNVAGDGSTAQVEVKYTVTGSNATGNAGDVVVLSNTSGIADGASAAFFNADQCGSASPADCTVVSGTMSDLTKSYGGVVITSDKPIVALVNEVGFGSGLDSKLYEGFGN